MRRPRVLVVDDNTEALQLAVTLLQSMDCDVEWAYDGDQSLGKLTSNKYDLVILDWLMPEMDGRELLMRSDKILHRKLQRSSSGLLVRTPVLIYSSVDPQDLNIPDCEHLCIEGFLSKGMKINHMQQALKYVLQMSA